MPKTQGANADACFSSDSSARAASENLPNEKSGFLCFNPIAEVRVALCSVLHVVCDRPPAEVVRIAAQANVAGVERLDLRAGSIDAIPSGERVASAGDCPTGFLSGPALPCKRSVPPCAMAGLCVRMPRGYSRVSVIGYGG